MDFHSIIDFFFLNFDRKILQIIFFFFIFLGLVFFLRKGKRTDYLFLFVLIHICYFLICFRFFFYFIFCYFIIFFFFLNFYLKILQIIFFFFTFAGLVLILRNGKRTDYLFASVSIHTRHAVIRIRSWSYYSCWNAFCNTGSLILISN